MYLSILYAQCFNKHNNLVKTFKASIEKTIHDLRIYLKGVYIFCFLKTKNKQFSIQAESKNV